MAVCVLCSCAGQPQAAAPAQKSAAIENNSEVQVTVPPVPPVVEKTHGFVFSSFEDNWVIYYMKDDGSGRVNLTKHSKNNLQPAWSPDTTKIAFVSDRDEVNNIYVMNVDGSNVTRLTYSTGNVYSPTWSPDSNKLAFVWGGSLSSNICTMDQDGKNLINLTEGRAGFSDTLSQYPIWSPDGKNIAFINEKISSSNGVSIYPQIYVYNVMTGDMQNIISGINVTNVFPCWSPDSSKIAFYSDLATGWTWNIFITNADGSNTAKLSDVSLYGGRSTDYMESNTPIIHWAPDGSKIALMSKQTMEGDTNAGISEKWEIMLIDPDGRNLSDTGKYVYDSSLVAWSPDSKYLAYVPPSNRYDRLKIAYDNLAIMDIATQEVKTIFDCHAEKYLTWR
jgi:Tol biopolymer transport system component